jgi:methionyl-tRNA synthetase
VGAVPEPGPLEAVDEALLALSRDAFDTVGALLKRSRIKAAVTEAMRLVGETNKYLSDMAPWKLAKTDTARMATVLYVALQLVDDCKTLLTPFLPHSSQQVHELLGGAGDWSGFPEIHEVTEDGSDAPYLVITGSYASAAARWESTPLVPGTPLAAPTPIFRKLDPSIVDDELRRLAGDADSRQQPPS